MVQQVMLQGRCVWGHPGELRDKKDAITKQIKIGKDGQPQKHASFGLAIERNHFMQHILPVMQQEARTAFPHGTPPKFAWKYKDGDVDIDEKGKPYNLREGYPGHVVITISTSNFAPPLYKSDGKGGWVQVEAKEVKCGDFFAVDTAIKYNGVSDGGTPGLYINPNGVLMIGYGQEITTGKDPDGMFGNVQVQQFAGMSAQPVLSHGGAMPSGMGAAPQQYAAPVQQPQQYAQPAAPQQYAQLAPLPAPAHDFVQNATGGYPQQYAPAGHAPQPVQPQQVNPYPGAIPAGNAQPVMGYPSNPAAPQPQQYGAPAAQPAPYGMPGQPAGR